MKLLSETVYQENLMRADAAAPLIRFKKSYTEFDSAGRQIKELSWDAYGNVEQMLLAEHDDNGLLLKQEVYLDEDELSEEHLFEYDDKGRITLERRIYIESGEEFIHYGYDSDGHLVRKTYTDEEGETESYEEWEYEGDLPVAERRFEEGSLVFEHQRSYEDGRLTRELIREDLVETEINHQEGNPEIRVESRNGRVVSSQSLHFDENGRVFRVDESSEKGRTQVDVSYDEAGKEVLREELREDGVILTRIRRSYTAQGQPLETEIEANTRGIGIDRHYKYTYEYQFADLAGSGL
jgi:hypothetical protein